MKKPIILLTNDDGINAPGLKHLWNALRELCDLFIVAPSSEKSGAGLSLTLRDPLHIEPVSWEDKTPAWKVSGTPADCVRMATHALLPHAPDLVISGINKGANSGRTLLYSGTVGGAIEGVMHNIPSIALSCEDFYEPRYHFFEPEIFPLIEYILNHPLPKGSLLNVTFPSAYEASHKGYCLARQGLGYYKESPLKGTHPEGREYYWMGGDWESCDEHEESDVSLLQKGYITAVPVHIRELTDQAFLNERKKHFDDLFQKK